MKKITNDENIKNLKTRKILRYLIILLGILTIFLSILSLIVKLSFIYPLLSFLVMTILSNKRERIPIKVSKAIREKRVQKAKEKNKKKK